MKKEKLKIRVIEHPVVEYDDRTIDKILWCLMGTGLQGFVHDAHANKGRLYDYLTGEDVDVDTVISALTGKNKKST